MNTIKFFSICITLMLSLYSQLSAQSGTSNPNSCQKPQHSKTLSKSPTSISIKWGNGANFNNVTGNKGYKVIITDITAVPNVTIDTIITARNENSLTKAGLLPNHEYRFNIYTRCKVTGTNQYSTQSLIHKKKTQIIIDDVVIMRIKQLNPFNILNPSIGVYSFGGTLSMTQVELFKITITSTSQIFYFYRDSQNNIHYTQGYLANGVTTYGTVTPTTIGPINIGNSNFNLSFTSTNFSIQSGTIKVERAVGSL